MFHNFFFGSRTAITDESAVPEINDDQIRNPFNHIYLFTNHTSKVHHVIKLDNNSILSCDQNKKGVIWDCKLATAKCELVGHSRTISSALLVNQFRVGEKLFEDVVVTASTDETIRVWDIEKGDCLDVIKEHKSAVKFLTSVNGNEQLFVSAGQNICLWNANFKLLYQYERPNLDYVHTIILAQNNKRLITASDQRFLTVYEIAIVEGQSNNSHVIRKLKDLSPHRQSITVLVKIADAMFASASMDGTIIIWSSFRFNILRKFNHYENFMSVADHTFPYSVPCIITVDKTYLIAAIGCGFEIFDVTRDECLLKMTHAHHSLVTSIDLLDDGKFLATSSADASVRLWASPLTKTPVSQLNSKMSQLLGINLKESKSSLLKLELVGICYAHSNSVQSVIGLEEEGFASFGSDGVIILWKNGQALQSKKDEKLRDILSEKGWIDEK